MRTLIAFTLSLFFLIPKVDGRTLKMALVVKDGYWKIIDTTGGIVTDSIAPFEKNYIHLDEDGIIELYKGHKVEFRDIHNKFIGCYFTFEGHLSNFVKVFAAVFSGKWGLIDKKGRLVLDTTYDYVSGVSKDGTIIVQKKGLISIVDTTGKTILPFFYQAYTPPGTTKPYLQFSEGLLAVAVTDYSMKFYDIPGYPNLKIGFVDTKGKLVLDTIYHSVVNSGTLGDYYRFTGGRCVTRTTNGLNIIINTFGIKLDSFYGSELTNLNGFIADMFHVENETLTEFEQRDRVRYGRLYESNEINQARKYRVHAPGGNILFPNRCFGVSRQPDGYFRVQIKPDYTKGTDGSDCLVFQFADSTGRLLKDTFSIAAPLDYLFSDGKIYSENKARDGLGVAFGSQHRYVVAKKDFIFNAIDREHNMIIATYHGKAGLMDFDYHWIIKPEYEEVMFYSNNIAGVRKNGRWGYINRNKKQVVSPRYDIALPFEIVTVD